MIKKLIYAFIGLLLGVVVYSYLLAEMPKQINPNITTQKPDINYEYKEELNRFDEMKEEREYLLRNFKPNYDQDYKLLPHPSGFEYEFNEYGEPIGLIFPDDNYYDEDYEQRIETAKLFSNSYHISDDDLRYFESINLLSYGRDNPMWYWVRVVDEVETEIEVPEDQDQVPPGHTVAYDTVIGDLKVVDISDIETRIKSEGVLPVKSQYYGITSQFGPRKDPFTGKERFHAGLDIANEGIAGREVFSVLNGEVKNVTYNSSLGNFVIINHGYFDTVYAHLEAFGRNLKIGDKIESGTIIGYVGSTGRSTGPHLHLEFDIEGVKLNPERFMNIINGTYDPSEEKVEEDDKMLDRESDDIKND